MQIILTLFELLLITLGTLYLFRQYPNKQVQFSVKAICFTSWFLSFAIIILVPLDLYYTMQEDDAHSREIRDSTYEKRADASFRGMSIAWNVIYWTSFFLTWFVLPLLQEFVDAGEFTAWGRFKRSLKVNLAIYTAMGLFGVIFILYLKVSDRVGEEGIVHFLITFANCFGIVLIIICLSYGLVYIPKRCFQQTRQGRNLKIHQFQAAVIDNQRSNLVYNFEGLIKTIIGFLNRDDVGESEKVLLQEILAKAPQQFVDEVQEMMRNSGLPADPSIEKCTPNKIASLNKKMKKKLNEMVRLEARWEVTIKHASFLEDITKSKNPTEWRTKRSYTPPPYKLRKMERAISTLQWVWYAYLSRVFFFLVGVGLVGASIIVFLAEIMNFSDLHIFNIETYIRNGSGTVAQSQFLCLIPLFYICFCVYSALFNMRLAGRYGLYRHHQTDAASLVFASLNFSRVSSPLVFNFLQMLQIRNTAFHSVMGEVQFAYSFMTYFPLLLVVLIVCNIFDVYGRILNTFGLKRFKFNEESTIEKIEEGKKLLLKARIIRPRSDSGQTLDGRSAQKEKKTAANNETQPTSSRGPSPYKEAQRGYMLHGVETLSDGNRRSLQDI